MNAARQERLSSILQTACTLPPVAREEFLRHECQGDDSLRDEIKRLVAQRTAGPGTLDRDALAAAVTAATATDLSAAAPPHVQGSETPSALGRYRIVRKIGEGGMGAVYEAEQDKPRRTVALKIIRPGCLSPTLLRRFELESQALARLQHPGIAQVYEVGVAPLATADAGAPQHAENVPYFAMEYVRGRTLTDYAASRGLGNQDRLGLVARICDAVQHAHQRGVIHRDLKPANILVAEEPEPRTPDGRLPAVAGRPTPSPQPKILDFGLARLTEADVQATMQTDAGQIMGTLPYMSPEQAAGDPGDLDTRADVYALGVIAYELLARRLPLELAGRPVFEALRAIREQEPAPLSSVDRGLRGDVETIVAKALEKDKTRRYQSAGDLAADIERYLRHEPITARPATAAYLLRRFARRNRVLVGGALATLAALLLGLAGTIWKSVEAGRARDRAESNAALANARLAEVAERRANLARQRGQWKEVIDAADEALRIGLADPFPALLLRLEAVANLDPRNVDAEIARVRAVPGVEAHAAPLELWRAEPRLSTAGGPDAIAASARSALELGLTPADEAYARSLLATDVPEAIAHVERCLELDPFHSRANQLYISYLMISGRTVEAVRRLESWLTIEPGNVTAITGLARLQGFLGRHGEASRLAATLEGRLDPGALKELEHSLGFSRTYYPLSEALLNIEPWLAGQATAASIKTSTGLMSSYGSGAATGTHVAGQGLTPLLHRLGALQLRSQASTILSGFRSDPKVTAEMYRLCPSSMQAFEYATALSGAKRYSECLDIIDRHFQGREPFAFARLPHFLALTAAAGWYRGETDQDLRRRIQARAEQIARRILGEGPMDPVLASGVALSGATLDRPWMIDAALADLDAWEHSRPVDYPRALAFQKSAKNTIGTLFLAEHGLRRLPADSPEAAKARQFHAEALAALRKQGSPPHLAVLDALRPAGEAPSPPGGRE